MEGKPERMSEASRSTPPLPFPLLRVLASSDRWMPARTPTVPAMTSTPAMMISVPSIWSRRPPVWPFRGWVSTPHFQCGAAWATTEINSHAAGARIRSSDR